MDHPRSTRGLDEDAEVGRRQRRRGTVRRAAARPHATWRRCRVCLAVVLGSVLVGCAGTPLRGSIDVPARGTVTLRVEGKGPRVALRNQGPGAVRAEWRELGGEPLGSNGAEVLPPAGRMVMRMAGGGVARLTALAGAEATVAYDVADASGVQLGVSSEDDEDS